MKALTRFCRLSGLLICGLGIWMPSGVQGETDSVVDRDRLATGQKVSEPGIDVVAIDRNRIVAMVGATLLLDPVTITRHHAALSPGSPNDFFSMGDYWWPNTNSPDGLPYYHRPGRINPDNFTDHRKCVSVFRDN